MKRMTAKKRLLVVFIAAVAVGATVALVFIFQFFGDAVRERSDLYISARTDYPGLLDSLRPRTDHHWAFDRYAGRLELERSFKPGHYVLEPGMNVVEIARMLKLGMQTPVRVTLNYARTRAFLASRLARQLDADSAELIEAGRVEINHLPVEKPHAPVYEQDVFTVRGKGRFRLTALPGKSKKDRSIIEFFQY